MAYALAAHSRHIHGSNRANWYCCAAGGEVPFVASFGAARARELVDSGWIHGVKRRDPETGRQSATDYILTVSDRSQGATQEPGMAVHSLWITRYRVPHRHPGRVPQAPWKSRFTPARCHGGTPSRGKYCLRETTRIHPQTTPSMTPLTAIANVVDISR